MPCHWSTCGWLLVLWTRSKQVGQAAFNVCFYWMFFTWLALALPDHRGLNQPLEIFNFWLHHWMLLIIPIHLFLSGHFQLIHDKHYYFKLAVCIGGILHWSVMIFAALASGVNVGYLLRPPPHSPLTGRYYRWGSFAFLVVMGWVSGYAVPFLLEGVQLYVFGKKISRSNSPQKQN